MVAFTSCCHFIYYRHFHPYRWYCVGSVYLFYLLMENTGSNKEFETIIVINVLFTISYFLSREKALLLTSLIISVVCLSSKWALHMVHHIWTTFFTFLGKLNSKLLLFVVFFLFLVPIAFLKKVLSKQKLTTSNNFKVRNHLFTGKDLERMG